MKMTSRKVKRRHSLRQVKRNSSRKYRASGLQGSSSESIEDQLRREIALLRADRNVQRVQELRTELRTCIESLREVNARLLAANEQNLVYKRRWEQLKQSAREKQQRRQQSDTQE